MSAFTLIGRFLVVVLICTVGAVANAATLNVHCGQNEAISSIGAAMKLLQAHPLLDVSNTINVSGNCQENVVIQSLDHLTLNAINGASISDASGGKLDVIDVFDSRDVAINGFIINAGADGLSGSNGISCAEWSSCRLSGNVIQGAADGSGFLVAQASLATLDGDTLQNNGNGLAVLSGSKVRGGGQARPLTSRGNLIGVRLVRDSFAYVAAVIENNASVGIWEFFHSTLDLYSGSVSGNGLGARVREGSDARFEGATITGNIGVGVEVGESSLVTFLGATVTGNHGGQDVVCDEQFSATRGVATTGGTTTCVEP
jgi:hypothetical protein